MNVLLELLILIVLARVFGEAAEHLGQPSAVGELSAGVMLTAAASL